MAIWSQALPGIAYTLTSRRSTAGAFVVLGGMVAVLANVIGETVGRVYGSNLVVGYLVIPFTAGAYILALAAYQVRYVERLTLRIGLGLFVLIYVLLVGFFEDFAHFGQYSHTLYSFVLLVAALWTLGRRSLTQEDGLAIDTEWFWVAFGLAIYGAATSATAAIGNILMARDRVDLFVKAWNLRAVLVILAFLAITWGVYRGPARETEFAPNQ